MGRWHPVRAALMALHNSATRYIYSLSRARILPAGLSHTRHNGTPQRASAAQFAVGYLLGRREAV